MGLYSHSRRLKSTAKSSIRRNHRASVATELESSDDNQAGPSLRRAASEASKSSDSSRGHRTRRSPIPRAPVNAYCGSNSANPCGCRCTSACTHIDMTPLIDHFFKEMPDFREDRSSLKTKLEASEAALKCREDEHRPDREELEQYTLDACKEPTCLKGRSAVRPSCLYHDAGSGTHTRARDELNLDTPYMSSAEYAQATHRQRMNHIEILCKARASMEDFRLVVAKAGDNTEDMHHRIEDLSSDMWSKILIHNELNQEETHQIIVNSVRRSSFNKKTTSSFKQADLAYLKAQDCADPEYAYSCRNSEETFERAPRPQPAFTPPTRSAQMDCNPARLK